MIVHLRKWLAMTMVLAMGILSACTGTTTDTTEPTPSTTAQNSEAPSTTQADSTSTSQTAQADLDELTVPFGSNQTLAQFYGIWWLGVDKGFFEEEGIDVTFTDGQGSGTMAQLLASGEVPIVVEIGPTGLLSVAAADGEVTAVAGTLPLVPQAVLSNQEIATPQDLVGLTINVAPGGNDALTWNSFLVDNGVDPASLETVNLDFAAAAPALAAGLVDGVVSFDFTNLARLREAGIDPVYTLPFRDWGFEVRPGQLIAVNSQFLEENRDLVQRFVRAAEKTFEYALENPDIVGEEVAEAGMRHEPEAYNRDVTIEQVAAWHALHQGYSHPLEEGQSILTMFLEDWVAMKDLMESGELIPAGVVDVESLFTNEFVEN